MAQHDYNIANAPGATVRADLNAAFEANASLNSGASAPSATFANMLWYDTTNSKLKMRNPGNTAWIELADISGSTFAFVAAVLTNALAAGSVGTTQLANLAVTTGKIAADAVDNTKLANMATARFKGRTTSGTGDPEDLTATQATALLNAVVGDSGSGGTKGLVPAPGAGDAAADKYLHADGTWTAPGSPILSGSESAVVSFDVDLSAYTSVYRGFRFEFYDGTVTVDGAHFSVQTSTDGGASFTSSAGSYYQGSHYSDTNSLGVERHDKFGNDMSTMGVLMPFLENAAAGVFDATVQIMAMNNANRHKLFKTFGVQVFDGGQYAHIQSVTVRPANAAINALRFIMSSGNMTVKWACYPII